MSPVSIEWLKNPFRAKDISLKNFTIPSGIWEGVCAFHEQIPGYQKTPLHLLKNLATACGVGGIWVKDESDRFGLDSFKVLGGTYAVYRSLLKLMEKNADELSFSDLFSLKNKSKFQNITFAAATAGNHGKGLAWAARELGARAIIYVNSSTTVARIAALEKYGAIVTVIDGNYDDSVRAIKSDAAKNGWHLIADTAWEGYTEVPSWIMQGYTTLLSEAQEDLETQGISMPTHLFVQAGVGSFAAAAVGFYAARDAQKMPINIIVEPQNAACYFESIRAGDGVSHTVEGPLTTMMAGLACGEPNPLAWEILKHHADYFLRCTDEISAKAMRTYHAPQGNDARIVSGESGAVTLGALLQIIQNPDYRNLRAALHLDKNSQILLINTEGATDLVNYAKVCGIS